jgi:hypothetical protein
VEELVIGRLYVGLGSNTGHAKPIIITNRVIDLINPVEIQITESDKHGPLNTPEAGSGVTKRSMNPLSAGHTLFVKSF